MNEEINYNVHNIIKFKICRQKGSYLIDKLNLKFSYFRTNSEINPEIVLNIGEFEPQNENCHIIDHKYHIKTDYLYCKESVGKIKWSVEFHTINDGKIVINFNSKSKGLKKYIYPDFLAQNILLKVIEYRLNQKKYLLAHGAAISENDKTVVLLGRGGSFKTSICMDFVNKEKYSFLGDDRVIIGENSVYSFPMNLDIFSYMCGHLNNENSWDFLNKSKFLLQLVRGKQQNIDVAEKVKIGNIYFISKMNRDKINISGISRDEIFHKCLFNNRLEDFIDIEFLKIKNGPLYRYLNSYFFVYPDEKITDEYEDNLKQILIDNLSSVNCYDVDIPQKYSNEAFVDLKRIIDNTVIN